MTDKNNNKPPLPGFTPTRYLAPRHWPTWIGLGLLRAAATLPYAWQLRLGAGAGRLLYYALPGRRRIAAINLRLCLPELDDGDRTRLLKRHFRASGIAVFETALSWWGDERRLRELAHVHGQEHLQEALDRGKGVILLSGHFTSFEIGGRLLSLFQPIQFMYKKQRKNPLYEAITLRVRTRIYRRAVKHSDARGMVRGLRENRVCWYLPDQDLGRRQSVFAPFMGISAATTIAPARFARMTGAAVVPYYPLRRDDGTGYDLHILPAWNDFPSGNDEADAARINQFLEGATRERPEQYLWLHRRFKTRPDGEPPIYPKRRKRG